MSLKIRLKRAGSKKRPFYRVVVTDSRKARDSRSIEDIGYYNPLEDPVVVNVDRDKVAAWTAQGAVPSETVRTLLRRENSAPSSRRQIPDFSADAPRAKPARDEEGAEKGRGRGRGKPREEAAATAVAEPPAAEAPAEVPKAEAPKAEAPKAEATPEAPAPPAEAEGSEPKPES